MEAKTKRIEITTTADLPRVMVQHMTAILGMPPEEALGFMVETYFGWVNVENLEPALLNRAFESEEQAVLGLNEYCARVLRARYPGQSPRLLAHRVREMAAHYLVRCGEDGWGVELAAGVTFAE
jgi:hypothetical protein